MSGEARPRVRRGGTAGLPGGRRLVWSVAEGGRGWRWRSVTTHGDGRMEASLLVEVGPQGELVRLECATGEGLLTVHPDGQPERLHGNVVRASGVDHVDLPWSPGHILLAGASPVTAAIAAAWLADRVGVGEGTNVPAVEVGVDLRPRSATWHVARTEAGRWRLLAADGGPSLLLETDEDGLPTARAAAAWPLGRPATP